VEKVAHLIDACHRGSEAAATVMMGRSAYHIDYYAIPVEYEAL
jgi:hypothetical protein